MTTGVTIGVLVNDKQFHFSFATWISVGESVQPMVSLIAVEAWWIARFSSYRIAACTVNVCDRFCVFRVVSLQMVMWPDSAKKLLMSSWMWQTRWVEMVLQYILPERRGARNLRRCIRREVAYTDFMTEERRISGYFNHECHSSNELSKVFQSSTKPGLDSALSFSSCFADAQERQNISWKREV